MSQAEAEFWSWVASEKAKLDEVLRDRDEPPTLLEWLERGIQVARETAFSLSIRQENGAEYWTGYADALETLLRKLQRREVRV
ncbi:hypothetical protein [Thermococcus aciditolerans]|uniref:Uncharacterized protein n=1 Tax=Thermococcus aciditolerans TaxID=2598455 RepID=A0A5C0SLC6_9EURY|nr:hypothetical protein [Thermococcus aciditolerans]QEK14587.1 hypothetical protein FPV09_05120 [Thermococcus aciditolerans]